MITKKLYYKRTNGGLVEWRVTEYWLFGLILIFRSRFQIYK